jgi:thioredoxin-like negative regulator of GroEL
VLAGALLAITAAFLVVLGLFLTRPTADELVRASRAALQAGNLDEARRLARDAVERTTRSAEALVLLGEIELRRGDSPAALACFRKVADAPGAVSPATLRVAGEFLFELRRLSLAERCLHRVLTMQPADIAAHRQLAALLGLAGRREAARHLLTLVQCGDFTTHELALLGNLADVYENPETTKFFNEPLPDDPLLILGAARYALHHHESAHAAHLFAQLVAADPADVELQAGLGRALAEIGMPAAFYDWHEALTSAADADPEIWRTRAQWAQQHDEPDTAIRCYWESLRLDPNDWTANYQLALLLHARGDLEQSHLFQQRADRLRQLQQTLSDLHLEPRRLDLLLAAAQISESLGRLWEAWGWNLAAADLRPGLAPVQLDARRLQRMLTPGTPSTLAEANPALRCDLASFAPPNWRGRSALKSTDLAPGGIAADNPPGSSVRFADVAAATGVHFAFHNGDDPKVAGMPIRASTGGGVAVLDYDCDGWPDLHLTQGSDWPNEPGQDSHLDQLYRNGAGQSFSDVTWHAGVGDDSFSQGAAAGDFDGDGFPDLYVANIGLNRLYHNNGDGTFEDATTACGISGHRWTTSCLLADLNGDGLPDLYDVTYLAGREPLERVCYDDRAEHAERVCMPGLFPAEQDRLYCNRGDGSFADVGRLAGIHVANGKGLGVVAGEFCGAPGIDVFVANDTTANFLFVNVTAGSGDLPRFDERAVASGCAYDALGRAQACMGIAVDDANGDGHFDMYVTNFYNEYNVLYAGQPGGVFDDRTGISGLKEPSLQMLGFGTQFLDADLDGWPDLVVANGHIDDFSSAGIPFRMRPQYYHNSGGGRFQELAPHTLGPFFSRPQLGRSLARLDFNRDGREDFVVSHLDSPAALLANQTAGAGAFCALQLRGVASDRDAVGTVVRATAGGRTRWKQLLAGDGYQSSNQRQIVIGLGDSRSIDELEVRWPSGRRQLFVDVPANAELLLREDDARLLRLPPVPP